MKDKVQGKNILVQGNKQLSIQEVNYERGVESHEFKHAQDNIAKITTKFKGLSQNFDQIVA